MGKRIIVIVVFITSLVTKMFLNAEDSQFLMISDKFFLGSWLENHDPEKLVLISKNYAKQYNNQIYQLKVLEQSKAECGIHAFRNALYIRDMFSKKQKEFNALYKQNDK